MSSLLTFLLASLIIAVAPGPGVLYIVTRTMSQGRLAGMASVAAVALGNFANAFIAAIGLGAVIAVSSTAFAVVKLTGGAYLCYLGFRTLRYARQDPVDVPAVTVPLLRVFQDGFIVSLLNPKTALFFAAFIPQFTDPGESMIAQSASFGAAFVAIAVATDSCYVIAAHVIASKLVRHVRLHAVGRYASAATYLGLGALAALSSARSSK